LNKLNLWWWYGKYLDKALRETSHERHVPSDAGYVLAVAMRFV
jgi:hypothetical protein